MHSRTHLDTVMEISVAKGIVFIILSGALLGFLLTQSDKQIEGTARASLSMFTAHPDPMWIVLSESEKIAEANPAAQKLFGYSASQMQHLTLGDLFLPDEMLLNSIRGKHGAAESTDTSRICRQVTREGSVLWTTLRWSDILYHNKPAQLFSANDITQLSQDWSATKTEDASIIKTLQRLKAVADSIQDGFVFLDSRNVIIQANRTFLEIVGATETLPVGRKLLDVGKWMETSAMTTLLQQLQTSGRSGIAEVQHPKDHKWYRVIAYPNDDGSALFLRDISSEKSTERQLQIEHERILALINNTESIIFTVDKDSRLTLYNSRFAEAVLSQRTYPPLIGDTINLIPFLAQYADAWQEAAQQVLDGKSVAIQMRIPDRTHALRYKVMRMAPLRIDATIVGIGVVIQDIHNLQTSLDLLERSNKALSEIAQISSHRLRGPLTSIITLLGMLEINEQTGHRNAEVLQQLTTISTDVDAIIHDLVKKTQEIDG